MENYTLLKNKPETFNCQFKIDGAESADAIVRLCLEFDDNRNMFFYGELKEDGNCEINIPSLKDIKQNEGKLTIEVIADSTYFKVHEANVELKNSVEVKMATVNGFAKASPKIQVEQVSLKPKQKKEFLQEEAKPTDNVVKGKKQPLQEEIDNPYVAKSKNSSFKLKSFNDFLGK